MLGLLTETELLHGKWHLIPFDFRNLVCVVGKSYLFL